MECYLCQKSYTEQLEGPNYAICLYWVCQSCTTINSRLLEAGKWYQIDNAQITTIQIQILHLEDLLEIINFQKENFPADSASSIAMVVGLKERMLRLKIVLRKLLVLQSLQLKTGRNCFTTEEFLEEKNGTNNINNKNNLKRKAMENNNNNNNNNINNKTTSEESEIPALKKLMTSIEDTNKCLLEEMKKISEENSQLVGRVKELEKKIDIDVSALESWKTTIAETNRFLSNSL